MTNLQNSLGGTQEIRRTMAISNELSSEIAAAILAETKSPQELDRLRDVVLQVHTTLQQMSEDARVSRTESKLRSAGAQGSNEHPH